jgi:hypothetical protein
MSEWIDVRERLPETGQVCLMITQANYDITRIEVSLGMFDAPWGGNTSYFLSFRWKEWNTKGDFETSWKDDVLYWMPIDVSDLPHWTRADFAAQEIAKEERAIAERQAYVERLRKENTDQNEDEDDDE